MKLNERKFMRYFSSGDFSYNDFVNPAIGFTELPDLWSRMNHFTPEHLTWCGKKTSGSFNDIRSMHLELQWHDRSIQEHTDDIQIGNYFQMCVVLTKVKGKDKSAYITSPVFNFYDELGNKRKEYLRKGQVLAFNPRKPHSMIYYGEEYGVALRTVHKVKPK